MKEREREREREMKDGLIEKKHKRCTDRDKDLEGTYVHIRVIVKRDA